MKYLISIVVAAVVIFGAWYGYGQWQRHAMLSSGKVLLLVNTKQGVYTYSDLMQPDDITSDYKIVGYADQLAASQIAEVTQGLQLVVGVSVQAGDSRVPAPVSPTSVVPTEAQKNAWTKALATLLPQQTQLCNRIEEPTISQSCFVSHFILNALSAQAGIETCAPLYIPQQKKDCEMILTEKKMDAYLDKDNNHLIDAVESYGVSYDAKANTLNLPVVNPSQ